MTISAPAISVLLVDDNLGLGKPLSARLEEEGMLWRGQLARVDFLRVHVSAECPEVNIVLLDLDMPGKDPLQELVEFSSACPSVSTIIFSGYYTKELVEAAVRSGARGYVCKIDGVDALVEGINAVMDGQTYLSPQARSVRAIED